MRGSRGREAAHLRIGDRQFPLGTRTFIMGIINLTPDSFSDGGRFQTPARAVGLARRLVQSGADLLDLGAESTRPGAVPVDAATEMDRLLPCLEAVRQAVDVPLSVDTCKAEVAAAALAAGADMVNDVSGLRADPDMAAVVAQRRVPVVVMHRRPFGSPYPGDVWEDVRAGLEHSLTLAAAAGIPRDRIILDPGFGFGKTPQQNLRLVTELEHLAPLGLPVLLGPSRKGTIGRILNLPEHQRVEGTAALVALAVAYGVDFVRVHDVGPMVRVARVADAAVRGTYPKPTA